MNYVIEQEHTKEECLQALDQLAESSPRLLDSCYLGCKTGEHKAYCIVEAVNDSEVREMVPSTLRGKSHFIKVDRFTPEQIRSFHQA
jgi:hypothetical protein